MANYSTGSTGRKVELTPLIDVIFLLLIFFLVTLNIIPILGGQGKQEVAYPLRALNSEDVSRATLLVEVYPTTAGPLIYLAIPASCVAGGGGGGIPHLKQILSVFQTDGRFTTGEISALSSGSFGKVVFHSPSGLVRAVNTTLMTDAVVFCDPRLPFEKVSEVISVLQGNGLAVRVVPMALQSVSSHWETVITGVQKIYKN